MRNKKISADISEEANSLLVALVNKHERSKGWLIDKMIKKYCQEEAPKEKAPRSKPKTYPKNIEEQFEILWQAKGRKGAKTKAYTKYRSMLSNESEETCESLTGLLVAHIESSMNEIGFPELHLTTYLNQERWEQ